MNTVRLRAVTALVAGALLLIAGGSSRESWAQLPAVPAAPAGGEVSFIPPEGSSIVVRSEESGGKTFLSVNDVVAALGGTVGYDAPTRSYEARVKQHSAVFGTESPLVVVDTRLVNLQAPVRGNESVALADLEFFQKVLGPMLGLSFAWERTGRILSAHRSELPEVTVEATVAALESTTKVVFRFSQPPTYRVEKSEDQVVLKLTGVRLSAGFSEKNVDDPRVARLLVHGSDAAVVLRGKNLSTNVYSLGSPPRLVIDVTRPAAPLSAPAMPGAVASPVAPGPPGSAATPAPGTTGTPAAPGTPHAPSAPPREAKTVVLDAGHGGTENGAKGPEGLLEKDATLALTKTIKETLTRRGYHVITTRDSDASVGLEDRAATANTAHADVFLSIHCNASRTPSAHGTEVYYLSLDASDRAAATLAENENHAEAAPSSEKNAALRDLDLILWDLAQNQHLAASARLAEIIQGDFNRLLSITTRGVKQAPFKVLIGVNAPAVLVEVAFITNPDEERKLASEDFRRQTAETLAGSLEGFFRSADAVAPVPYAPLSGGKH